MRSIGTGEYKKNIRDGAIIRNIIEAKNRFFSYYGSMRKRRELKDGASYHVYARINRQEYLLQEVFIKKMFIAILKRAKKKYSFHIGNYCIMSNHIHFILKPLKGESLSVIMRWILGVFAQKYNRTFDLHGHVWYDRFKSKIIIDFRQYLHTFVYISNNPVKAGLVGSPVDYPFNGIFSLQKGIPDLMERPPNRVLRVLWSELFWRKHLNKNTYPTLAKPSHRKAAPD